MIWFNPLSVFGAPIGIQVLSGLVFWGPYLGVGLFIKRRNARRNRREVAELYLHDRKTRDRIIVEREEARRREWQRPAF